MDHTKAFDSVGKMSSDVVTDLPVIGLGTSYFYTIHFTALSTQVISIAFSVGVILYQFITRKGTPFFRRTIGERLTFYLAVCDIGFTSMHSIDHIYMVAILGHPPDGWCTLFGFLIIIFMISQGIVVFLVASLAFLMVVRGNRPKFGKYDWKLLASAYGVPIIISSIMAGLKWLGPSGAW